MQIHGKEYTEVKDRIKQLFAKHPLAVIRSEVQWNNEDFSKVCIKAYVWTDPEKSESAFTGLAYEERSAKEAEVNGTSWVENCETSAIGRALANMDIGVTTNRPSAEEMKKLDRMKPENGANIATEILTFGKHKGTRWIDAPPDYLDWLVKNEGTAENVKEKAKQALAYSDLPWEK